LTSEFIWTCDLQWCYA